MDGNIIDLAIEKWQWLLDHPEVTWSGSGIYALSLTGTAVLAVAGCVFRRKKKSPPSSEEPLRQPLPTQKTDNQFNSGGGEQTNLQGDHGIAKQINNSGVPPEYLTQYAEEFGVTKTALANFFRILEQQKVPSWDLDSKLREIATQHKELLLRFEAVQSDDPQVKALKEQAGQAIENGDYDRADALLNQAKERDRAAIATLKASLAEQQAALEKRQLSEAKSCVDQAKLQRLQYRYEKSAQYFQEAAAALPEGHEAKRAACLGWAGYDLSLIDRYADALYLDEQSLSIYRKIGNRKGEGITLNNISLIYSAQGEYDKALEYLEQSLPIRREVGDKEGEGTTLNNISQIYHDKGDYPQALKYLEQSLPLLREMSYKEGEGATLNNIGQIHYAQGDDAAALEYYKQALTIAREIKDKATESKVLNNIGQVYHDQSKLDAAFKLYEQSLAIIRQIGDRRNEGTTLNNIGKIYEAKKDYPAALKQYEQALAIAKEIGNKDGEAIFSGNIGWLYKKQGDLAKAESYISWAVELGTQLEHPDLQEWRKVLEDVRAKLRGQR